MILKHLPHISLSSLYSRLQKSCNTQAEQWKTTIDLPHMNLIIFPASACPFSLFKHSKSIVVFHCSACLLQDFCNLLYLVSDSRVQTYGFVQKTATEGMTNHILLRNTKGGGELGLFAITVRNYRTIKAYKRQTKCVSYNKKIYNSGMQI